MNYLLKFIAILLNYLNFLLNLKYILTFIIPNINFSGKSYEFL